MHMMASWRGIFRVRFQPKTKISCMQHRNVSTTKYLQEVAVVRPIILPEKTSLSKYLASLMNQYEEFVGLSEVRQAQNKVLQAQKKFMETQESRRDRQQQIQTVQQQLKDIHVELDKTSRGEDRYLHLITREHAIIKQEKQLLDEFTSYEKAERDYFSHLSDAVRESHEKERAQAEKTKYWSVIGSVCGAIIGIIGTTVNHWLRMRELKGIVADSSAGGTTGFGSSLQQLLGELSETAKNQHNMITVFIADLKGMLTNGKESPSHSNVSNAFANTPPVLAALQSDEKIETRTGEILAIVKQHESDLKSEMKDVKALILARRGDVDSTIQNASAIYVGKDVEEIIREAQQNLEYKMKVNALATVAMIYGVLALAVPIMFKAFGGT